MINLLPMTSRLERLKFSKLIFVTLSMALSLQTSHAASRSSPELGLLTEGAELIFLGTALDIRYAESANKENPVPHTFVTYSLEKVFQGAVDTESASQASGAPGKTVTLRFAGGPRSSDGAVLRLSHVPRIDVGDRDVLFVRANAKSNNPLTQFLNGRMRVIDNALYSEEGQEIVRVRSAIYTFGAKHDFKEVISHSVDGQVYSQRRDDDSTQGDGEGDNNTASKPGQAITLASFVKELRDHVVDSEGLQPVVSADPSKPFAGPAAQAVASRSEK